MKNVFKLKVQAQEESYDYFDNNIRSLPKDKNGKIEQSKHTVYIKKWKTPRH